MSFELKDIPTEKLIVNVGPSHPATHGTLRAQLELDGERIVDAQCEIGYLHRCFEKECEVRTYSQVIPYTERLNYCSALMNSIGWCLTIEKLFDVEAPPRAQAIRVVLSEFSRIIDHFVCLAAAAVDAGALTNYWYLFNYREKVYSLLEEICGARLTLNYPRVGGVAADMPEGWADHARSLLDEVDGVIAEVRGLLEKNRIFQDRMIGVGKITAERAIEYGFTGPCLRACGVNYDIRKVHPYMGYDQYEFDVPRRYNGDAYDRFFIRFDECEQSVRIARQALDRMPDGDYLLRDPRVALPPKAEVYGTIEGLVNHFKLIFEGIRPPKGEVYMRTEAANGELGYYVVSTGEGKPYRAHCRAPCFALFSAYPELVRGEMVADAIVILSGLNIIAGELDR